jgi:GTP-binding protein SAR1
MFLVNWFYGALQSLGLMHKHARILFLGLDNAGKTSLLHMLRDNRLVQHAPTHHPTNEELSMGNVLFRAYDLGGHRAAQPLWKEYFQNVQGVVYLVDASDIERVAESKLALDGLLMNADMAHVPFLILCNKIDAPTALSEHTMRDYLGLLHQTTGRGVGTMSDGVRPIELFMCSVVERAGYGEGFKWLAQYIK